MPSVGWRVRIERIASCKRLRETFVLQLRVFSMKVITNKNKKGRRGWSGVSRISTREHGAIGMFNDFTLYRIAIEREGGGGSYRTTSRTTRP